jgi:hypothetical protein
MTCKLHGHDMKFSAIVVGGKIVSSSSATRQELVARLCQCKTAGVACVDI